MTIATAIKDGFVNLVNSLGTAKDARTSTQYALTPITPAQLLVAYRSNWLARRIVDSIADDATREWRDWQASADQIQLIEEEEKKHGLQHKVKKALIKSRLYGGAALVMGLNNTGDVSSELDFDRVKQGSLDFVVVLSSFEMTRGAIINDIKNPWFGRPEYYRINNAGVNTAIDTMTNIHPSRVIEFQGSEIPDWNVSSVIASWGDSVLQVVDDILKDYGMTISSIAAMVSDCKVDVFTIPGLTKQIANADYERRLVTRLTVSNQMKSSINAMVMDENEKWARVQSSFNGLNSIMSEMLKIVAGAAGIPLTKLVGHGAGSGTSMMGTGKSGGESDLHNYFDDVASRQRNEYGPLLAPLDEVTLRSALPAFDDKVYYQWAPLYTPDPMEEVEVASKKATLLKLEVDTGLINPDVLREVRINQLIEDNTYPGLQAAVDEFGAEPEEPTAEDIAAQTALMQKSLPAPKQKLLTGPKPAVADADWNEGDHPRDDDGQFTESPGPNQGKPIKIGTQEKKGTHVIVKKGDKVIGSVTSSESAKQTSVHQGASYASGQGFVERFRAALTGKPAVYFDTAKQGVEYLKKTYKDPVKDADWNEGDHPRDDDGKWTTVIQPNGRVDVHLNNEPIGSVGKSYNSYVASLRGKGFISRRASGVGSLQNALIGREPKTLTKKYSSLNKAIEAVKEQHKKGSARIDDSIEPRTLYVRRDVLNAKDIARWALKQGLSNLVPMSDMHVTIAYSKQPVDWMKAVAYPEGDKDGVLLIPPGGVRIIDRFGEGAVVLVFGSSSLSWRHESIKRDAEASWDWDEYQPHITLSYDTPRSVDLSEIIPYRGEIKLGPEIFEEIK